MSLAKSSDSESPTVAPSKEEVYQALLRSLRRRKGFGIVFVQSSPAEVSRLIKQVRQDLPQKRIEVIELTEPIDNLYKIVDRHPNKNSLNILFIDGLEKSLEPYIELGYGGDGSYYNLETVPRILNHLNQQRENFRDHFSNICFVFILPLYGIKYFIRRAPDFFDWSAGVFEFPAIVNYPQDQSLQVYPDRLAWEDLAALTPQEKEKRFSEIESLLANNELSTEYKSKLFFEKAKLLHVSGDYELAIANYEQSINMQPDHPIAWNNRGTALSALGRYQEALDSYERALEISPDFDFAWNTWNNRGLVLEKLGFYEEAIVSYDRVLAINPNLSDVWNDRGLAFANLGKFQEAIESFEKAVSLQVNFAEAWSNRGLALTYMGRYKEAISSFNQALEISPTNHDIIYSRACCYALSGNEDLAIKDLQQAITANPGKYLALVRMDEDLSKVRENEQFQAFISVGGSVPVSAPI